MKVEAMNSVNNSYQGQGSSGVSVTEAQISSNSSLAESTALCPSNGNNMDAIELSAASQSAKIQPIREEGQASNEQIRQAVEKINRNAHNEEAVFGIHDATNRVTIKIIDKETKEVIKEFPPEKTLDMIAKVWEMAGIMVDERR